MMVISQELDSKTIIIQMTTKNAKKNHVSGKTLKRVTEDTASDLMKSGKKRSFSCPKDGFC